MAQTPIADGNWFLYKGIPYLGEQDAAGTKVSPSLQYIKADNGLFVPVSSANPVPTKLTGSSFTESQALATRSAHVGAVLTQPILMDFKGKTAGQTWDVPHVVKWRQLSTFEPPNYAGAGTGEIGTGSYGNIASQNGVSEPTPASSNGQYAQHLFSFDLLTDLKLRGIIPKWWTATELKAALKQVIVTTVCYGVGSSGGVPTNGANIKVWNATGSYWTGLASNTYSSPGTNTNSVPNLSDHIDSSGKLHVLVHATHPSDGTNPSTIFTDYIKVEVQLAAEYLLTPDIEAMGRPGNVAPGKAVQVGGRDASGNLAVPRVVAPADAMPATHEGIVAAAVMMGSNGASRDVVRVVGKTIFFDGALTANTDTLVANPAAGKKFRLLGYVISWNVAQNTTIVVKDGTGGTIQKHGAPTGVGGMAVLLPPNGYLSSTANNGLYLKADQNVSNVTIRAYVTEE